MTSTIKKTSKTSNPPKAQACIKKRLYEDKPALRQIALCRTTHGVGYIPLCGIFKIENVSCWVCLQDRNLKLRYFTHLSDDNFEFLISFQTQPDNSEPGTAQAWLVSYKP